MVWVSVDMQVGDMNLHDIFDKVEVIPPIRWKLILERRFLEEELAVVEPIAEVTSKDGWPLVVQFTPIKDQETKKEVYFPTFDDKLKIGDKVFVRDLIVRIYENKDDSSQRIVRVAFDPTPTEDEEWEYWEAYDPDALQ